MIEDILTFIMFLLLSPLILLGILYQEKIYPWYLKKTNIKLYLEAEQIMIKMQYSSIYSTMCKMGKI
jgi:hypothetical protein